MSDKDLDDLFKKASAAQNYPYDSASWPTLAKGLEASSNVKPHGRWRNGILISSAVLLVSIIALLVNNDSKQERSAQNSFSNEKVKPLVAAKNVRKEAAVLENANRHVNPRSLKANNKTGALQNDSYVPVQTWPNENQSNSIDQMPTTNEENFAVETEILVTTKVVERADVNTPTDSVQAELKDENQIVKENRSDVDEPVEKEIVKKRMFALKVSVSPDFSSEKFSKSDKMGENFGATIEYYLGNFWSISTGVVRSRKFYTAEDVTYGRYTAEFVEGDCRMWDLPLNVAFYLPGERPLSVFISTGVSSYLMSRENYDYYPDADDRSRKYSAEIRGENNEWFKMLNLSVGLQRQFADGWAIQAEPFVKVPFSGIGEGNIELASFGMFLSLKYQLSKPYAPKD